MKTHSLERTPSGYRCTVCEQVWRDEPVGECVGMPLYRYWREVPPYLKTKTQRNYSGLRG